MAVAHFVFIHTICHGAWVWHKLKPVLEAAGHKVTALDLVASGTDVRVIEDVGSFDGYSEPLLNFLETIPEGEKVILVGESCGGINVAIAADIYTDKIAAAVFHNSLMPDTVHGPSYVLDEDLELAKMLTRKGSTFQETLQKREPFTNEGYGSIKKIYIYGKEDKIMTKEFHQWQIQNYKPEKVYVVHNGGHKLMLSRTIELFKILQEVADEYASLN
ncbi:hypothetical protein GH714_034923 [Hevea brasiliensis]|uniref:AB hydrolase-1 domain-containing protein n=1 Tax=Hevea brasiliensis TaxID=3981 RepID=A0A6A6KY51_HEVBR|nr:hypothetical protein GH714_034923 [Hevea brasiliensis]